MKYNANLCKAKKMLRLLRFSDGLSKKKFFFEVIDTRKPQRVRSMSK